MSHSFQAVKPRLWTDGGAKPFTISRGLTRPLLRRVVRSRSQGGAEARQARASLALAVAALAVIALTSIVTSALTYRAGRAWRDRAATEISRTEALGAQLTAVEAELAASAHALDGVRDQLAVATSQLQRSEADVAQLEGRLQALGSEKARVEDEREVVRDERDRLALAAGLAARAGDDLDACIDGLSGWLASRPRSDAMADPRLSDWAMRGDEVTTACVTVQAGNHQLQSAFGG